MQFIAPDPVHVNVRSEVSALYDNSGRQVEPKKRRVYAKFWRGLPSWAVPIAVDIFKVGRVPPDFTPQNWFAMYDTVIDQQRFGWTEEEMEAIVAKLRKQGYLEIQVPESELPYPAYAKHRKIQGRRTIEMAIEDIVGALKATDVSTETVRMYEADHGDKNSEAIVEGVQAAFEPEPEPELVEA